MQHLLSILCRQRHAKPSSAWVLLGLLMLGPLSIARSAPEIRFAPEKDYGPFVFEGPDGKIQGLSIDLLDALRPLLDHHITTLPAQPLARILQAAQRGEVDLISSLRPTAERSDYLAFTPPYIQVPAVLVLRQSVSPAHLVDLAGQRVAIGQGYAVEAYARKTYPDVVWQTEPDDLSALRGLLQGRYQAVVADIASVGHAIRTHQLRGLQVVEAIGFDYALSFAYRKDLGQFGQQLQTALQQLDPKTRQTIVDRWIDTEALRFEDRRRTGLRRVGLVLALLAAQFLLWAHWRRRQGLAR